MKSDSKIEEEEGSSFVDKVALLVDFFSVDNITVKTKSVNKESKKFKLTNILDFFSSKNKWKIQFFKRIAIHKHLIRLTPIYNKSIQVKPIA